MKDKTKSKNWENGDVFALKIDNGSEYDGRYILLETYRGDIWKPTKKRLYFRAKLTKDNILPKTFEEIEKAEYIKVSINGLSELFFRHGYETFSEVMKKIQHQKYEFDKYGYVYTYYFELRRYKNNIEEHLIYLGNFDYPKKLKHEKILRFEFDGIIFMDFESLIPRLIESYEQINLEKSECFNDDFILEMRKRDRELLLHEKDFDKVIERIKNGEVIEPTIPEYGWGPKLYDIDQAYEYKEYFKEVYSEEKTLDTMGKELASIAEEETRYNDEKTIFWMVIADNFLKKGMMNQELKDLALKCIRLNLKLWEPHQDYKEREKELNKLKKRLEEYECSE